ncbi:hypothetical protein [Nocardia terpenica]|uniref:Uncharacterized protein n=1 Tax=Nocardia terpenica TaxID=455432 RepID=A0A164K5K0_9NOCA|nr:hypothetical protein [Nocardia terpenica]KZM71054.1 hypothetical protein AWN90_41795 [Nocardia terpenica]NQE89628.1 hypothetical protein [Nocardia terpenica]
MTMPNQKPPDGAFVIGSRFGQDITEQSAKAAMTNGVKVSFGNSQDAHHTQYNEKIAHTYTVAVSASGSADKALTTAQAAANTAASAERKADVAYVDASYWEAECVVASAEVLLGVNELLIGLAQNVPLGKMRRITDIHIALLTQPNGVTIETKKWDANGTTATVVHTAKLGANVTRWSAQVDIPVADKERVFWNVAAVPGSTAPTVLQILVFGSITEA